MRTRRKPYDNPKANELLEEARIALDDLRAKRKCLQAFVDEGVCAEIIDWINPKYIKGVDINQQISLDDAEKILRQALRP